MNRKKGFTLIELLAVIVILAVIALIATPIIMNVIHDAKKGADKDSAHGYIKALELTISKAIIKNSDVNLDGSYLIDEQGNLERYNNTLKEIETFQINYKGSIPKGTAQIKENKIIGMDLVFDIGSFLYDGKELTEKTDKNLFPVAKWQTNEFVNYNGPDKLLMIDGTVTFSYIKKHNVSDAGYIGTGAEQTSNLYNGYRLYQHGIIVKPNTTYRYSVDVTSNTTYKLLVLYGDKSLDNLTVKYAPTSNTNTMEFTTGANTRYATFRVDLFDCTEGTTGVYKNFQVVEK